LPVIKLQTVINSNPEIVFNLSRSIELHKESTKHTKEEAVAGKTRGLMELHDTVTWRAKHLGVYLTLTSQITEFTPFQYFTDEMVKGPFKRFVHQHIINKFDQSVEMIDVFEYESPFGLLGKLVDSLFLEGYMRRLLITRNQTIKAFAESERWREILKVD
jgi:ligand-binding SRPBCC domain-containing protein